MKFFPDLFLKNRYLNKTYRIPVVIYRNLLEPSVADSRVAPEKLGAQLRRLVCPAPSNTQ